MTIIYHYDGETGLPLFQGAADANPLDPDTQLLPAYATPIPWPETGEFECARYLTVSGHVPAHHADGAWFVQPDWRDVPLWSTEDGSAAVISEPNVIPADIGATTVPYPGPGYVWRGNDWQEDPAIKYQLAEQAAERELARRQYVANAEINRIKPAVDGGYAKQEDVVLLPKLQRYLYELPDVRTKPGWPEKPQWPTEPEKVI
ncbi:tail fiber assembly protein [Aeromonas enteropelogenes]|uniref:tail fiber assembly protein n=1 Tax=Aeromonas enteropelogenes TaxID=29489 RepID=UPI003988DD51